MEVSVLASRYHHEGFVNFDSFIYRTTDVLYRYVYNLTVDIKGWLYH